MSAGQALQRVLLTRSACGVAAARHSQPLELIWLREFVRTRLSGGSDPQLLLRLGTVTQRAVSVRATSVMRALSGQEPGTHAQ